MDVEDRTGTSGPEAALWWQQLDEPHEVEIRPIAEGRRNLRAGHLMLYPNGRAVDDALRMIPQGESRSQKTLRAELARRYHADITCPVTTRKSLLVVAEVAYEAARSGTPIENVTPFWRIEDWSEAMLRKLSFDPVFIFEQREREGV